jgi:hypothetical protein
MARLRDATAAPFWGDGHQPRLTPGSFPMLNVTAPDNAPISTIRAPASTRRTVGWRRRRRGLFQRQMHAEGGALADLAFHLELAVVFLDDTVG